jgi:hypothetical protein
MKTQHTVKFGEVKVLPLKEASTMELTLQPHRMDLGAGRGTPITRNVTGGALGVIIDARGRPLERVSGPPTLLSLEPMTLASQEAQ